MTETIHSFALGVIIGLLLFDKDDKEEVPDKICETGEDVYVNMEFVGCTDYHQSPANTWTPKSE